MKGDSHTLSLGRGQQPTPNALLFSRGGGLESSSSLPLRQAASKEPQLELIQNRSASKVRKKMFSQFFPQMTKHSTNCTINICTHWGKLMFKKLDYSKMHLAWKEYWPYVANPQNYSANNVLFLITQIIFHNSIFPTRSVSWISITFVLGKHRKTDSWRFLIHQWSRNFFAPTLIWQPWPLEITFCNASRSILDCFSLILPNYISMLTFLKIAFKLLRRIVGGLINKNSGFLN